MTMLALCARSICLWARFCSENMLRAVLLSTALLGLESALQPSTAQSLSPSPALQPLRTWVNGTDDQPAAPWRVAPFPGGNKPLTQFDMVTLDGQRVLRIRTDKSYANLLHDLQIDVVTPRTMLRWRWRLDEPLLETDLRSKSGDDSALKVCVLFDLPLEKLGLVERNLFRVFRNRANEKLPAETLCYIWDHALPSGSELANAFSQRVRFVVLNTGETQLKQWQTHSRDIEADFRKAFGHETNVVPPLVGIAVGGDSDNTGGKSLGYVADVLLTVPP